MVYTLSYSNLHESEENVIGKQALYLGKVARRSLVPCVFFVITSASLSKFFEHNSLREKISALDSSSGELFWSSLKDLFSVSVFPDDVKNELRESYDALSISGSTAGNILRSFDSRVNVFISSQSSSGLNSVILNIKGFDNLLSAIKSCWFSHIKMKGVDFLNSGSFFSFGLIVEKFVSGEFSVEVEPSSDKKSLLVSVYKGLPEVSAGIVKDFYVLSFNHLEFVSYELNHQNFSILHQEDSGVLLKKRLGKEGADNKASKQLVSECGRLSKRIFDVLDEFVKVIFIIKKDVPYLFFVDCVVDECFNDEGVIDSDVDIAKPVFESVSDDSYKRDGSEAVVTEDVYGLDANKPAEFFDDDRVSSDVASSSSGDDVEDSFVDADEFIIQGEKSASDSDDVYSSFFKLVELLEEDITKSYVESFGFSPSSIEEAVFEIDSKHGFDDKNKVLRVLEVKSLIMQGEEVDEDILSSLSGVIEDFLKKEVDE